jgi:hypothetical protein
MLRAIEAACSLPYRLFAVVTILQKEWYYCALYFGILQCWMSVKMLSSRRELVGWQSWMSTGSTVSLVCVSLIISCSLENSNHQLFSARRVVEWVKPAISRKFRFRGTVPFSPSLPPMQSTTTTRSSHKTTSQDFSNTLHSPLPT